jgi:hypothetical protein
MPSYPIATNGIGKQLFMTLSGTGVTNANPETPSGTLVGGNNTYKVKLSLANSISAGVSATALVQINLFDLAGNSQSVAASVTVVPYQAPQTAPVATGTNESYIGPNNNNVDSNGFVKQQNGYVASFGAVNPSAQSLVVPAQIGNVVCEYRYPLGVSLPSSGSSSSSGLLLTAGNFAILGGSAVTGSAGAGSAVSGGNIGIAPNGKTSVTNFPPSTLTPPGIFDYADAAATQAQVDLAAAIVAYEALTFTSLGTGVNMATSGVGGSNRYTPGNYSSTSSLDIPTDIVLDAQGNPNAVFVFYATASTVTLESGASVKLINGAQASNVYWIVGSSFTSIWNGIVSNMVGNILAHTSITLGGGTLAGRALANTGAVTISTTETITVPTPAVTPVAAASVVGNDFVFSQLIVSVIQ